MSVIEILEADRRRGEQLKELVIKDRTKIEPRVSAGLIDGLIADLPYLRDIAVWATDARQAKKAATKSQINAAELLFNLVMAGRATIKLNKLDAEVIARAGVGKNMNLKVVKSVLDGAEMMIQAYAQYPDPMRRAGVLPADIEQIQALRAQLTTVDVAQEEAKLTAKEKTAARNEAHKRVKAAIAAIVGAAELAFVNNPERLALYRAILPTKPGARKSPAPVA
ncbi:MAG: hypothetical protein CVU59_09045 [Deltaproteobacteria bacterium HGW-Deltaproteobacteria-17]|nr:MAG: hypothetical protein CVU59_09045 [Deltaproteobacteria bacterium HGW-Deltaproteobacteria-17]